MNEIETVHPLKLKDNNATKFKNQATQQYTETVVAIAIGVLTAVFVGALFILVIICRRQRLYYKANLCEKQDEISRPDVLLIEPDKSEVELGEVRLNAELEQILADEQWIDDATGLVPHCIALLKICHTLTERLTALAMSPLQNSSTSHQIGEIARKISIRVDDVVRSMYPPLDPRLLEARAAALGAAVSQLALLARYECGGPPRSSEQALQEMDAHLIVLREAALSQEAAQRVSTIVQKDTSSLL